MWGYGMSGCGMIGPMSLWWVLPLGIMILAIYGIIQLFRSKKGGTSNDDSNNALEQLRMRFALGEVTQEEYLERKKLLQS